MTIASEITRINNNITSAYTACNGKGATMPQTQNSANLATCISSIPVGSSGINREVVNGVYQAPNSNFTFTLPTGATDVGAFAMAYAFNECTKVTAADLSSLTSISNTNALYYAFNGCTRLESLNLSSLTSVTGTNALYNAFQNCKLTSLNLSSLTNVSGSHAMYSAFDSNAYLTSVDLSGLVSVQGIDVLYRAIRNCSSLTTVKFDNLEVIGSSTTADRRQFGGCFGSCRNLTSITFPKLKEIYCSYNNANQGTFSNNDRLEKLYFPKLDTISYVNTGSNMDVASKNIFNSCTALTEIHFGAANQAAIQATGGYATNWGATNATVYFDL